MNPDNTKDVIFDDRFSDSSDDDDSLREYSDDLSNATSTTEASHGFLEAIATHEAEARIALGELSLAQDDSVVPQNFRLHGLPGNRTKHFPGSTRTITPRSLPFADMYHQVTENSLTGQQIAGLLIPFVSTIHPLDRYPESFLPAPGTEVCIVCRTVHAVKYNARSRYLSYYGCYAKRASEHAQTLWLSLMSTLPTPC